MVPFDVGVTNTVGTAPRFVVATWAVAAGWLPSLAGFRLRLEQEAAPGGAFVPVPGWEAALVRIRPQDGYPAPPPNLTARTVLTPAAVTHYRLPVLIAAPSAGARVRLTVQSELAAPAPNGATLSTPVTLVSTGGAV